MSTEEEMARMAYGDEAVNKIKAEAQAEVYATTSQILGLCTVAGRSLQDAADFVAAGLTPSEVSKRLQADKNIMVEIAEEQHRAAESLAAALRYRN